VIIVGVMRGLGGFDRDPRQLRGIGVTLRRLIGY
jgi:hypothetical protein